jgi:hypothetical protein
MDHYMNWKPAGGSEREMTAAATYRTSLRVGLWHCWMGAVFDAAFARFAEAFLSMGDGWSRE